MFDELRREALSRRDRALSDRGNRVRVLTNRVVAALSLLVGSILLLRNSAVGTDRGLGDAGVSTVSTMMGVAIANVIIPEAAARFWDCDGDLNLFNNLRDYSRVTTSRILTAVLFLVSGMLLADVATPNPDGNTERGIAYGLLSSMGTLILSEVGNLISAECVYSHENYNGEDGERGITWHPQDYPPNREFRVTVRPDAVSAGSASVVPNAAVAPTITRASNNSGVIAGAVSAGLTLHSSPRDKTNRAASPDNTPSSDSAVPYQLLRSAK